MGVLGKGQDSDGRQEEVVRRGGYEVGKDREKSKRTLVSLPPDLVDFIVGLDYEMRSESRRRVTTCNVVRSAVRAFRDLPREEQLALLED